MSTVEAAGITIDHEAIRLDGRTLPLADLARAEVLETGDHRRSAVILLVALVAPITIMWVSVGAFDASVRLGLWFGPVMLAATVIPAILGGLIALAWKKRPAVVVCHRDSGSFRCLARGLSATDAERLVAAINGAVAARAH